MTEAERVAAFAPLLASRGTPYILLGDFNALDDTEPYTVAGLTAQMSEIVVDRRALAARMLDRQLLASVRAGGLVDALPVARRTHHDPDAAVPPACDAGGATPHRLHLRVAGGAGGRR